MKKIIIILILTIILSGCSNETSTIQTNNINKLINVSQQELSVSKTNYVIKNSFKLNTIIQSLGYKSFQCIGYNNNNDIYLTLFKNTGEFQVYSYNLDKQTLNPLSIIFDGDIYIKGFVVNNIVYLAFNNYSENNLLELNIIKLDMNGNMENIYVHNNILKIPQIAILENSNIVFTINCLEKNKYYDYLYSIDLQNNKISAIDKRCYNKTNDNNCTGDSIVAMNCMDNILYYQVIALDNNILEFGEGTPYIYVYNNDTKEKEKYIFDKPVIYVNGDNNFIFTSDYNYYEPSNNSGRIFSLTQDNYSTIPSISVANSIIDVDKITTDSYVIYNNKNIMIYNSKLNTYEYIVKDKCYVSNLILSNNSITYKYSDGTDEYLIISQISTPKYDDNFSKEEIESINFCLINPYIQIIYSDDEKIFYMETSNYKYRPYEKSEAVIWCYDKETKTSEQLHMFDFLYFNNITSENGFININNITNEDVFNLQINIKSKQVIKNSNNS